MIEFPDENLYTPVGSTNIAWLWEQMLAGDKESFGKVYHYTFQKLYRYGCKMTSEEIVEEVIQELFIKLWHKRERLPQVSAPLAYLFRAFRNQLFNQLSKTKNNNFLPLDQVINFSYQISDESQYAQQREILQQAINKLSDQQREVIYLLYFNDLSAAEVADVLSLKIRTVYNTAQQAVNMLRKHLQKDSFAFHMFPIGFLLLYFL
ncbi:RNA polymerase sigma factor (sigma-70 family) [Catalinimonas alkaloidigena]|uniref:RNA polymerase sigma factor n=1 Tax=Catalinimonas alkaloidigena TaxID=1075417 RepID=UPI002405966D|nr:RNA polymerase sigma factor [Catalinimonas alkaloidigena]MDF9797068.1 RNA polymerase sigma factor (sigma-70 family) [Catalinimonas alkaloidigena]